MQWNTDRRGFLKAAGAGLAAAAAMPRFAWAAEGDTLRLRVGADFQVLDPFGIIGELDDIIPRCTNVTLVRLGDMREGNAVRPWAAEKIEWLDGTRLAFTLREGLKWTGDYGPVTAADVKFSYERIAGSDSAWAYQFEKLKEVEVVDDRNGIIHLTEAFAPFMVIALPYYGGHIVCQKAVEAAGGSYTTEIPAQCGPYLMDSWEQNQKVTLVSNPDWTGEKPAFSRVEFYIVTDDQAAQLAYEADAFDFTRVAVGAAAQLKGAMPEGATLIEAASTRYAWLTINMNAEPLKDIRVRQAIQYAYDGDANLAEAGITVNIQPTEEAAYWALGDKSAGEGYKSIELVLMNFAGGIDPTENLVWFRPDQIGVYNWSFFDSAEYEELYQASMTEQDTEKRRAMFNRMEDLMEESGGFIFICFEPYLAIHDANLVPVILADGHPDPVAFRKV